MEVFQSVRSPKGFCRKSRDFVLYINKEGSGRLGLSIAKKILKKASDRNRVKRCLRDFYRRELSIYNEDIVVRLVKKPSDFCYKTLTLPLAEFHAKKLTQKA